MSCSRVPYSRLVSTVSAVAQAEQPAPAGPFSAGRRRPRWPGHHHRLQQARDVGRIVLKSASWMMTHRLLRASAVQIAPLAWLWRWRITRRPAMALSAGQPPPLPQPAPLQDSGAQETGPWPILPARRAAGPDTGWHR
jgi:hypothetical protein